MEQSDITPNLNAEIKTVPKNLKTLGILSLIMGGLMILMSMLGIKKAYAPSAEDIAQQEQTLEMVQTMNPEGYDAFAKTIEDQGLQNMISLVTQIISVVGVILMLQLKKTGFYIYIFGEFIPYIITLAMSGIAGLTAIGGMMGESFQAVIWVFVCLMIVVDIVFVVLYSKQLKFMS